MGINDFVNELVVPARSTVVVRGANSSAKA